MQTEGLPDPVTKTSLPPTVKLASLTYSLFEPGHLAGKRPIIIDDSYTSPESTALHEEAYEGDLAGRSDSNMNIMSNYGKPPPQQQVHGAGFDSSRSFSEGPYAFPQPVYGPNPAHSTVSAAPFPDASTMTHMPYQNQPRATYDDQTAPYLNVGSTPTPVVKDFTPSRGTAGMKMRLTITTLYEIMTSNEPVFSIGFGQRKVAASFTRSDQQGAICEYNLDVEIPQLVTTGWTNSSVPISMYMESGDGDVIAKVDVGTFVYVDVAPTTGYQEQRKRKYSNDSIEMDSSVKRLATQHLRPKDDFNQYSNYNPNPSNYMSYPAPPVVQSSGYNTMPQYNKPTTYPAQRHMGPTYPSTGMSSSMRSPSGHWGTTYPSLNSMRSPGLPSSGRSLPSPGHSGMPALVRTTCLQQSSSPQNTPHGLMPQYNTYPLYPNRAQLEIDGDLDSMTINWTAEEWQASRRLVLFTRSQAGSTITTKFKPVNGDEKHPNGLVISCIMWPEKKECFVTSVEIIALLEVLVTGRFTVEEKNRIRRNLEGYRPLTVSKAKDDSANFFKTIMDFPLPKPRNIEKDIKVFYWKDLTVALKKIIGKYSASPSSILPPTPALLTSVSSSSFGPDVSGTMPYDHQALSPRSISAPSTAYGSNPNMHIRMSPLDQKMPLQSNDMRLSGPQMSDPSQWQGNQMPNSQYLGHQSARSWDLTPSFVDNAATVGSNMLHSQNIGYSNRGMENLDSHGDERRLSISRSQSQQMPGR